MSRADELIALGFAPACKKNDVPGLVPKRVEINGHGVLVIRQLMRFRALDETCPHRNTSMADGVVLGPEIVCPLHHYGFDLRTGECRTHPSCPPVPVYEVEVDGDMVYVKVPRESEAPADL